MFFAAFPGALRHATLFTAGYDFWKPITLHGHGGEVGARQPAWMDNLTSAIPTAKVVRWAIETGNPNALLRSGLGKDSLKPGDEVTIEGYLAKDGTPNGQTDR